MPSPLLSPAAAVPTPGFALPPARARTGRTLAVEQPGEPRAPLRHSPEGTRRKILKVMQPVVHARLLLEALAGAGTGEPGSVKLVRDLAPKCFDPGSWEAEVNTFGFLMTAMNLAQLRALESGLAAVDTLDAGLSDASLMVIRSLCAEFIDGTR